MTHAGISMFANAACSFRMQFPPRGSRDLCYNRAAENYKSWKWLNDVTTLAKRFYVSGRVQGVGYRFFAERVASQIGVAGYVRNLFDARVEVYAIGNAAQLDSLKRELQRGPRMASVDQIAEVDAEVLTEYSSDFSIEQDN
jgi:acylphosphatase